MDQYTVQMTDEALSNMEEIYRYIADKLKSSENAIGQYNRIADEILSLHIFPARYPLVDFEQERSLRLHGRLFDNYAVFCVAH